MDVQQATLAICGATAAYVLYQRYRSLAIRDVPGPKNPSWIHGISKSPTRCMTTSHRFWNRTPVVLATRRGEYSRKGPSGGIWKHSSLEWATRGTFNPRGRAWWDPYADAVTQEDCLWIADPKAIHRILQSSGYLYERPRGRRELIVSLVDRGLLWADGGSFFTLSSRYNPNSGNRRRAQTAETSHGSRIRPRRSQGLVPLLRAMFQFSQSLFHLYT